MNLRELENTAMIEYIAQERHDMVVGDWERPAFVKNRLPAKRPKISLRSESKRCGIRGRMEIRLRSQSEAPTVSSRDLQLGMRQNFKAMFEAGLQR